MRDAERQEEFLNRGRFGEGEETLAPTKVDRLFWVGVLFMLTAGVIFGSAIVFGVGRDDGGPFFVMGSLVFGVFGGVSCICGLLRMRSR